MSPFSGEATSDQSPSLSREGQQHSIEQSHVTSSGERHAGDPTDCPTCKALIPKEWSLPAGEDLAISVQRPISAHRR